VPRDPLGENLFDAAAYYAGGGMPFSFLAWPIEDSDERGLPRDERAREFLRMLEGMGLRFGVWSPPVDRRVRWAVVPKDSIESLHQVLGELDSRGKFTRSDYNALSNRLIEAVCKSGERVRPPLICRLGLELGVILSLISLILANITVVGNAYGAVLASSLLLAVVSAISAAWAATYRGWPRLFSILVLLIAGTAICQAALRL
jgi:hypothetical protein